jgi:hypothetical protein
MFHDQPPIKTAPVKNDIDQCWGFVTFWFGFGSAVPHL